MAGRRRTLAVGAALALGLATAVAGCNQGADRSAPSLNAATGGAPAAPGGAPSQAAPLAGERQVISTATLRIEVDDVPGATARVAQLASEQGGYVAGSQESGATDERRSQVTLKVPGDRFDRLVDSVSRLGEVQSKQVGTEDVTEQVVDLEARLRAGRAAAERLEQLIARAATVPEVVGVEAELAKRTAEIEALEGRLRVLRDKVDLATVTVTLARPAPAADDELPSFLAGLRGGWRALRATAIVGSAVVGALLPWLAPALLLTLGARTGWRRWRRRHPPPPRPSPQPQWVPAPPAPPPGPPRGRVDERP